MKVIQSIFLVSLLLSPTISYAQDKIGFVNVNLVFQKTKLGDQAKAMNQSKEIIKSRKKIDTLTDEFAQLHAAYKEQKPSLSPKAIEEREQQMNNLRNEINKKIFEEKKLIQEQQTKAMSEIMNTVIPIISQVAEEEGYVMVLDQDKGVIYGNPERNITSKVINRINSLNF